MGPRVIDYEKHGRWDYMQMVRNIKVSDFGNEPMIVTRILRTELKLDLNVVMKAKHDNFFDGEVPYGGYRQLEIAEQLREAGATVETHDNKPPHEPVCPCEMDWVELVDGIYYQIYEVRSPDGIKIEAVEVGPQGGPYKKVKSRFEK
jgi:hypothetical protein